MLEDSQLKSILKTEVKKKNLTPLIRNRKQYLVNLKSRQKCKQFLSLTMQKLNGARLSMSWEDLRPLALGKHLAPRKWLLMHLIPDGRTHSDSHLNPSLTLPIFNTNTSYMIKRLISLYGKKVSTELLTCQNFMTKVKLLLLKTCFLTKLAVLQKYIKQKRRNRFKMTSQNQILTQTKKLKSYLSRLRNMIKTRNQKMVSGLILSITSQRIGKISSH